MDIPNEAIQASSEYVDTAPADQKNKQLDQNSPEILGSAANKTTALSNDSLGIAD